MKTKAALAACGVLAWMHGAYAADGGATDAGPTACQTTADCAPPTPYCHPKLLKCVQCVADLNCFGIAYVCDTERGVCATCRTDGDCYYPTPYCSTAHGSCAECVSDANCGKTGMKCVDGICGTCGDGICSQKEQLAPTPCADCLAGCGKTDLGSKVGDIVVMGNLTATDPQYVTQCGMVFGPQATFSWTAPSTGTFTFFASNQNAVSVLDHDCAGAPLTCMTSGGGASLTKGQKVALVVTSSFGQTGPFTLSISAVTSSCDPNFCPIGPGGEPSCCTTSATCGFFTPMGCTPSPPPSDATQNCLNLAKMYGEEQCPAVPSCSCNSCTNQHTACLTSTKGCFDIKRCFAKFNCSGMDCYTPDRCAPTIDAYGGPMSIDFAYAAQLATCERAAKCPLSCSGFQQPDASVGMGGSPGQGTGGTPGGAGKRGGTGGGGVIVGPDASTRDAGASDVNHRPVNTSGGCGCAVPRSGNTSTSTLAAITALGAALGMRRKRGAAAPRFRQSRR